MLEAAREIEGWMPDGELAFLNQFAAAMPDGARVVEVGCWKGRSTLAIASGLVNGELWAVDSFAGDPIIWDHYGPTEPRAVQEAFRRNTSGIDFLELIVDESEAAAARFDKASLDWVFIDADHSYAAVVRDIQAWAPKLKPGAVLSGHDYGRYGVTEAVLRSLGTVDIAYSIWFTRRRPRPRWVVECRRCLSPLRHSLRHRR